GGGVRRSGGDLVRRERVSLEQRQQQAVRSRAALAPEAMTWRDARSWICAVPCATLLSGVGGTLPLLGTREALAHRVGCDREDRSDLHRTQALASLEQEPRGIVWADGEQGSAQHLRLGDLILKWRQIGLDTSGGNIPSSSGSQGRTRRQRSAIAA